MKKLLFIALVCASCRKDHNPSYASPKKAQYRIKLVNKDGTVQYSKIIVVQTN